jgi:hypothetical protein
MDAAKIMVIKNTINHFRNLATRDPGKRCSNDNAGDE